MYEGSPRITRDRCEEFLPKGCSALVTDTETHHTFTQHLGACLRVKNDVVGILTFS